MFMRRLLLGMLLLSTPCFSQQRPALGEPLSSDEIKKIDITVLPDGSGLPDGHGSVVDGTKIFAEKCQVCHGEKGQNGVQDRLTGGIGTLDTSKPVKTVNSYWSSATTLFDYVRRAMPLQAPQSLTNNEVYALTAYILSVDHIVAPNAVLDAGSLKQVKMPNANGFVRWWPTPPANKPRPTPKPQSVRNK